MNTRLLFREDLDTRWEFRDVEITPDFLLKKFREIIRYLAMKRAYEFSQAPALQAYLHPEDHFKMMSLWRFEAHGWPTDIDLETGRCSMNGVDIVTSRRATHRTLTVELLGVR